MSDEFYQGMGFGCLFMWVLQWPIWSKLWQWLNQKLDEWANVE